MTTNQTVTHKSRDTVTCNSLLGIEVLEYSALTASKLLRGFACNSMVDIEVLKYSALTASVLLHTQIHVDGRADTSGRRS